MDVGTTGTRQIMIDMGCLETTVSHRHGDTQGEDKLKRTRQHLRQARADLRTPKTRRTDVGIWDMLGQMAGAWNRPEKM